ncbi:MAG TPA: outer membrane beta-barrel protein [Stellaceae bacterium]|nr:outer membrane beta-barrel protein [Stellaceae bacterium]
MFGPKRGGLSRVLLGAGVAAIALSTASAGQAAELWGGIPYIGLGGGLNFESDPTVNGLADLGTVAGPLPGNSYPIGVTKVNGLGVGALGLIAAGLDFKNGWRAELEGSYRHNSAARFNVQAEGSTSVGVDRTTYAMMANVWRDFALFERVDLHVGGGLGVAELEMNVTNTYGASTSIDQAEGAYQAGVGLDFVLIPGLKATLDYRAFGFFNKDSGNVTVPTSCSNGSCGGTAPYERVSLAVRGGQIDQSIIFGLRWSFGP